MNRYTDTLMVDGRPVEVTVDMPEGTSCIILQELAEKAWRSVNKEITVGQVTVKVRGFGR